MQSFTNKDDVEKNSRTIIEDNIRSMECYFRNNIFNHMYPVPIHSTISYEPPNFPINPHNTLERLSSFYKISNIYDLRADRIKYNRENKIKSDESDVERSSTRKSNFRYLRRIQNEYWSLRKLEQAKGIINSPKQSQAINLLNDAIELNERNLDAYFQRGLCYLSSNETNKAEQDFRKVLEIDSTHILAKDKLRALKSLSSTKSSSSEESGLNSSSSLSKGSNILLKASVNPMACVVNPIPDSGYNRLISKLSESLSESKGQGNTAIDVNQNESKKRKHSHHEEDSSNDSHDDSSHSTNDDRRKEKKKKKNKDKSHKSKHEKKKKDKHHKHHKNDR